MRHGTINCTCGQTFHFESAAEGRQRTVGYDEDHKAIQQYFPPTINCIKCNKSHDITSYPEKVEVIEEQPTEVEFTEIIEEPPGEGDQNGTDI
ncbi:MAG: hypothetical protein RBT15_04860 [Gudongella sp.]|jgi:hypothetical protein|nr:hypothetical protein [Gudongella sp.]